MSGRRMFRYVVPVDDEPHTFKLNGDPVSVATETIDRVEFWAECDPDADRSLRTFQVFGTGHPLPPDARWVGTCNRVSGLVWHLYERSQTAAITGTVLPIATAIEAVGRA